MIYGREKAKVPVTAIITSVMPKIVEVDNGYEWGYRTIIDFVKEQDKRNRVKLITQREINKIIFKELQEK